MKGPNQTNRQRDFSGGMLVEHAKRRDDEAVVRAGCRELRNARILSSGAAENRAGRSILFAGEARADEVRMRADAIYYLCFGDSGTLTVRDSGGIPVARAWGYEWDEETVDQIVWDVFDNDVFLCFPGQAVKIARWDGGTEWTFLDFAFDVANGGQRRCPFYRIAPKGITLAPSGTSGTVDIAFSEDYLAAGMVGNRLRYQGRQLTIATVTGARAGTATVHEKLLGGVRLTFGSSPSALFSVGDSIEGSVSGARGEVASFAGGGNTMDVVLLSTENFQYGTVDAPADVVIGPLGSLELSAAPAATTPPASVAWDEEVMNDYRGWPRSVLVDQNRVIFCDLPGVPGGISWSAIATPTDHYIGADPNDAFFEIAPKKARVYHVRDGADEFVFTDRGVYYIPISESNPLKPGSVAFRRIPSVAASKVPPVSTAQGLVYVNGGLDRVMAIVGTGQTAQPYISRPVSDLHNDLFSGVVCLTAEDSDADSPESRAYAVNADGSVVVGRYQPGKEWVGWVPWSGEGEVRWLSQSAGRVLMSATYGSQALTEQVDAARHLDASVDINDVPAALSASAGADLRLPDDQGETGGNMTAAGGLAAARNGTTAQSAATSASKTASTASFLFVRFGQPMKIAKCEVWPSSDSGFASVTPVIVQMRGYNGAADPTSLSDGTQLATTGSIADTTAMQTLNSNDEATLWDALIVGVTSASGTHFIGEVRIYTPGEAAHTGSLWFLANQVVDIMNGRRYLGTRSVGASGAIVPAEGEVLDDEALAAGFRFDMRLEPFLPHGQSGQSVGQATVPRQIADLAIAVQRSTGFALMQIVDGSEKLVRRVAAYNKGENEEAEPPLRETVETFRPLGTEFDHRLVVVKDTPGPLRILEITPDGGS